MKTFVRILIAIVFLIVALFGLVIFSGSMMPEEHSVTVQTTFAAPIDTLWFYVAEHQHEASWREDLKEIRRVDDSSEGFPVWEEVYETGQTMRMETIEVLAPTRIVRRVYGETDFGGTWTMILTPLPQGGTSISVTEDGFVKSPFFRFVMYKMMGEDATIKGYLNMIASTLGEELSFK